MPSGFLEKKTKNLNKLQDWNSKGLMYTEKWLVILLHSKLMLDKKDIIITENTVKIETEGHVNFAVFTILWLNKN